MPSLNLKNIYKRFGTNPPILNNINLKVSDHEILAILGASGSGKTSILRIIAGLDTPSSGELFLDDKSLNSVHPSKRNIGMVFEKNSVYNHLTVYENLMLPLLKRKLSGHELKQKVISTAENLKLQHALHQKADTLSSGERQKLAIGRALIQDPKFFLLDEPLATLDFDERSTLKNWILDIQKQRRIGMIYTTYNHAEALQIADQIVVLQNGFIQQVGTPQDLYDHPKNLYVANFIGYPKMNLIHGDLRKMGDQYGISFQNHFVTLESSKVRHMTQSDHTTQKVTLGIRPEHIKIINVEHADLNGVFRSEIVGIERVGGERYIDVDISGITLTLKSSVNMPLYLHDKVNVGLYLKKCHIFDGETDQIISH